MIDDLRYDLLAFDDNNVMVVRAASRATGYDLVITYLGRFPLHRNAWVIALVNLGPGYVWNLPRLTGWHPSYLAKGTDLSAVGAETVAQILNEVAPRWERRNLARNP